MKPRPRRPGTRPRPKAPSKPRPRPTAPAPGPEEEPQISVHHAPHVAPAGRLAEAAAEVAGRALHEVRVEGQRLGRVLAEERRRLRDLAPADHRFVSGAVGSLFRWLGWVEPVEPNRVEAQLLFSALM